MYIFIENGMIHNSELVPLIFELSLRLHPLPVRCPHSDCASRDTIKHGKGRRKSIPGAQRYLYKTCEKNLLQPG
jgi:transposase-like protein